MNAGGGDFEGLGLLLCLPPLLLSGLEAAEAEAEASPSFLFCSRPSSSLDLRLDATRSTKDQPPSERRSGTKVVSIGQRALSSRARAEAAVIRGQSWSLAGKGEFGGGSGFGEEEGKRGRGRGGGEEEEGVVLASVFPGRAAVCLELPAASDAVVVGLAFDVVPEELCLVAVEV